MDTNKNRRRIYFIEKEFQRNFILKFCMLVILAGFLTGIVLYLFTMQSATVSFEDLRAKVRTTADFLFPILIQTIVIVSIIVGLASITLVLFISHKIAGPLYRLKKELKTVESGDLRTEFHIRTNDQLQDLALSLNRTIKKLRENHSDLKNIWQLLKINLHNFLSQKISQDKEAAKEIEAIIQEFDRKLDNFKV